MSVLGGCGRADSLCGDWHGRIETEQPVGGVWGRWRVAVGGDTGHDRDRDSDRDREVVPVTKPRPSKVQAKPSVVKLLPVKSLLLVGPNP